mmetsp:Transcript_29176/g.93212  ORF Transcript_29176/g.93212 Transcript_29176/m.93212 type:complete len:259 (-) Transcript_29176:1151-1927(-)
MSARLALVPAPAGSQLARRAAARAHGRSVAVKASSSDESNQLGERLRSRIQSPWDFITAPARLAAGAFISTDDPREAIETAIEEARILIDDPRPVLEKAIYAATEAEYLTEKFLVTGQTAESEVLQLAKQSLPEQVASFIPSPPPPPPMEADEDEEEPYVPYAGAQDEAEALREAQAAAAVQVIMKEVVALRDSMAALKGAKADPAMEPKLGMLGREVQGCRDRLTRRLNEILIQDEELAEMVSDARALAEEVGSLDL